MTMGSTRVRIALGLALAALVVLTPGCFFMETEINVAVDGSAEVGVQVGVSSMLAQGQELGPEMLQDIEKGFSAPGWQAKPLEREGYEGVAVSGHVAPGGALMPGEMSEGNDLKLSVTPRLFSTDYRVEGKVTLNPPSADALPVETARSEGRIVMAGYRTVQDTPEEPAEAPDAGEEMPFDPGMLGQLLSGGMEKPHATITVRAPGSVLETDGEEIQGGAVWSLSEDLLQSMGEPTVSLRLVTRLLNQGIIGKLADRLAIERGETDMAALIADYVSRDLLPNPPRQNAASATFDVEAYSLAIATVVRLEEALGARVGPVVVEALGLNADDITAQRIRQIRDTVFAADEDELIEAAATAVVGKVQAK